MKHWRAICLIGLGPALACAQSEPQPIALVSHCDAYGAARSLSDIQLEATSAFLIRQSPGQTVDTFGPARFDIEKVFFGIAPAGQIELLRGAPDDIAANQAEILARYELHSTPAFFWDYASNPSPYGYSGEDEKTCNLVPVTIPEQSYIIVFENEQITLFEPVPDAEHSLVIGFDYFGREIFPTLANRP